MRTLVLVSAFLVASCGDMNVNIGTPESADEDTKQDGEKVFVHQASPSPSASPDGDVESASEVAGKTLLDADGHEVGLLFEKEDGLTEVEIHFEGYNGESLKTVRVPLVSLFEGFQTGFASGRCFHKNSCTGACVFDEADGLEVRGGDGVMVAVEFDDSAPINFDHNRYVYKGGACADVGPMPRPEKTWNGFGVSFSLPFRVEE